MGYPASRLPALLRHMTLAIYKKKRGSSSQRFMEAFKIARAQLVQYGYLTANSLDGPLQLIKLTGKGIKKNADHLRDSVAKDREFESLYEENRASIEVEDVKESD